MIITFFCVGAVIFATHMYFTIWNNYNPQTKSKRKDYSNLGGESVDLPENILKFTDFKYKYEEIVKHTFNNSFFKNYSVNGIDKLREDKWRETFPAIYVIGPENNISDIIKEATKEGFINLIKFLHPKLMKETIKEINGCDEFTSWMTKKTNLNCFGCHLSHVIVAKDIIDNNYDYALVLENDCKFEVSISNEILNQIKDLYKNYSNVLNYLNLGNSKSGELFTETKNLEIVKSQTFLTHSYIINKLTANFLYESVDISKPKPDHNLMGESWGYEQFYRAGADDFFSCYVNSFTLSKGFTFQQFIGDNRHLKAL